MAVPDAYLDHAASTPLRPEVVAAMAALREEVLGNPSGSHRWARRARRLLDDARDVVADAVGARPGEVVFTSGGTEADNLAVAGVLDAAGGSVLCSAVEHPAVARPAAARGGATVGVDTEGCLDLAALESALRLDPTVSLVSVMAVNNEVGTRQPVAEVAALVAALAPGAVVHTDAVAAAAWTHLPDAVGAAHLVSLSAHKVGGPPGTGALVVRDGTPLAPVLRGGGQERERRSGTPDVVGAVGFAAALAATVADLDRTVERVEGLRRRLVAGILASVPGAVVLGPPDPSDRTPGTVLGCFEGADREALVFLLDEAGIGASWGSSCASGAAEPSPVLAAMGVAPEVASGALRLSLGWCSTGADIDAVLGALPGVVARARGVVAPAGVSGS